MTTVLEADTPALLIDLDRVEHNIESLQRYCDEHSFASRPHIKTHKLPAIAHLQIRAGAVGIACQKLGEAEVMASAGLSDIFLTYPIVGREKVERLAALARQVRMSVVGDSEVVARGLSEVLDREGLEVDFLVECDTGFGRTGVQTPQAALALARFVERLPGLRFAGLMTYPTLDQSGAWMKAAREALEQAGLEVECVSGGGTPTAKRTHEIGQITEIRAGTYVYGDRACVENGTVPIDECALNVLTTVVSRPTPERAIIDAGTKTLTSDPAGGAPGHGLIIEYPDASIYLLNEEHGYIDVSRCRHPPEVGEKLRVVPNHACGTTNMHNEAVVHRSGEPAGVWPIAARGKVR
jgi:D-serine deaminase-like pyridoxal phosphate-dependent protein